MFLTRNGPATNSKFFSGSLWTNEDRITIPPMTIAILSLLSPIFCPLSPLADVKSFENTIYCVFGKHPRVGFSGRSLDNSEANSGRFHCCIARYRTVHSAPFIAERRSTTAPQIAPQRYLIISVDRANPQHTSSARQDVIKNRAQKLRSAEMLHA